MSNNNPVRNPHPSGRGEIKTPVGVIATYVKDEIPKQIKDAVDAIPKPVDGVDGSDGLGINVKAWKEGIYRKDSIVSYNIGQYFKALSDTSDSPDSESKDWERIGDAGFRMAGPYKSTSKYTTGDLYVKDFGLFLFSNEKSHLVAGRGEQGKRGEMGTTGKSGTDGKNGIDGSDIVSFETKETNLIMVIKDSVGKLKHYSVELSPLLEASIEVSRSFGEETLTKLPALVKSLLYSLQAHPEDEKATPIKYFRGLWRFNISYKKGDAVLFGQVLLLATEDNKGELPLGGLQNPLASSKFWRIMVAFETKAGGGSGGTAGTLGMSLPGDPSILQAYEFNPQTLVMGWADARDYLTTVDSLADLNDRTVLPNSNIKEGKLVYVRSTGQLFELVTDLVHRSSTMRDWKEAGGAGGVKYVGRLSNLPDPKSASKPANGALYVIEMDFSGKPYHRLVSWDESIAGAMQRTTVTPKTFKPGDSLSTQADLRGIFASGSSSADEGRVYVVDAPGGLTPQAGDPYAGILLPVGTKLINLGNPALGHSGWAIAPADTGYIDAATTPPRTPPPQRFNDPSLPRTTGGWRFLDRMNWVHSLTSDPDHIIDNQQGDFQSTIENGAHVLKVFYGTNWITLFSESEIKSWISSLALFRGTASENAALHVGTIQLNTMPDLSVLSAAGDTSEAGRYWIWQGDDNYALTAATPTIGTDLAGADLQVGDWLLVANRGGDGTVPGDPAGSPHGPVDLHWVRVGGDLLTASRGRGLFGLNPWVDGAHEIGTVVNHAGDLYRATSAILPGDAAPSSALSAIAPGHSENVTITQVAGKVINNNADLLQLLVTDAPPMQWASYSVHTAFTPTASGTPWDGTALGLHSEMVWTGFPTLNYNAAGTLIKNGWLYTSVSASHISIMPALSDKMKALALAVKWAKVDIGGGLKWVATDSNLPAVGNVGDTYMVVTSVRAAGKPALYTWDAGANSWIPISSADGATPLVITGGVVIYPRNYIVSAGETEPVQLGLKKADLLIAQDVAGAQYYIKKSYWSSSKAREVLVGSNLLSMGTAGVKPGSSIPGQAGDLMYTPKSSTHDIVAWIHDGTEWVDLGSLGAGAFIKAEGMRAAVHIIGVRDVSPAVGVSQSMVNFTAALYPGRMYKIGFELSVGAARTDAVYGVKAELMKGSTALAERSIIMDARSLPKSVPYGTLACSHYFRSHTTEHVKFSLRLTSIYTVGLAFGGSMMLEDSGSR